MVFVSLIQHLLQQKWNIYNSHYCNIKLNIFFLTVQKIIFVSIGKENTPSLENHEDGLFLHSRGVALSLQAILVCSILAV